MNKVRFREMFLFPEVLISRFHSNVILVILTFKKVNITRLLLSVVRFVTIGLLYQIFTL